MPLSLKLFKQVFYVFLMLLLISSLCYAQGGPQEKEKKPPKTIQLFAEGDDPANKLIWNRETARPKHYLRMRRASINTQAVDRFKVMIVGDTLSGYLFKDVYFKASVVERNNYGAGPFLKLKPLSGDSSDATIILMVSKGHLHLDINGMYRDRHYLLTYSEYDNGYVVVESQPSKLRYREPRRSSRNITYKIGDEFKVMGSGQYVFIEDGVRGVVEATMNGRGSKKRVDVPANVEGSKTVQIFAEDDDPENQLPWDESNFAYRTYVRRRKASVNPQLFADRIDEIHIGDTLVGKLFDGQYFEAVVFARPEGAKIPTLWLMMAGDDQIDDRVSLFSFKEKINFTFQDKSRKRYFQVCSREGENHHMVIEKDPSKRLPPYGEDRSHVPSESKKDK